MFVCPGYESGFKQNHLKKRSNGKPKQIVTDNTQGSTQPKAASSQFK